MDFIRYLYFKIKKTVDKLEILRVCLQSETTSSTGGFYFVILSDISFVIKADLTTHHKYLHKFLVYDTYVTVQ